MFSIPTLETGLLNKSSSLGAALGVTKVIAVVATNFVTLLCCLSMTLMFNNPTSEAGLLNKSSILTATLGAT